MSAPTYKHGLGTDYLSDQQIAQLLRAINPLRVSKDGKGFSHVEAYELRAHLNRILGFARWSEEVISQELVFESRTEGERPKWTVCYRSIVKVGICAPSGRLLTTYAEGACGDATNLPSRADAHDMALKTSQSQAFKRTLVNLGDQFGASLYNKGSHAPLVRAVLVGAAQEDAAEQQAQTEAIDAHITAPLAPERDETETPQRETSSPPESRAASTPLAPAPAPPPAAAQPTGPEPVAGEEGAEAIAAVASAFPGATEDGPQDSAGDPFDYVLAEIERARASTPAEARQILNAAMELTAKHRLNNRRVPEVNKTLSAHLVHLLGKATEAATRMQVAS